MVAMNEPLQAPEDMPDEPMEPSVFLDIPSKDTEPKPQVDRMTTTVHVYHEDAANQKITHIKTVSSQVLNNQEQSYQRSTKVIDKDDWKKVDLGWYSDDPSMVGTIVIENRECTAKHLKSDQRALEETRELLLSFDGEHAHIALKAKEGLPVRLCEGITLYVSTSADLTRYMVTVIPS